MPGQASAEPQPLPGVNSIIAVGSGKGGVGKTTLAVNLAIALARMGNKVGLLDADVYGPNVPLMLGSSEPPSVIGENRILPPERYGMKVISVGFLTPGDKPLVWRGPMLHSIIKQFLGQVEWGELDYLVVDLPPGTGDVVISLVQTVPLTGAVVVTTPSDVSLQDARKAIEMFKQVKVDILGIVENMSFFVCPHCHQRDRHLLQGRRPAHRRAVQRAVPRLHRTRSRNPQRRRQRASHRDGRRPVAAREIDIRVHASRDRAHERTARGGERQRDRDSMSGALKSFVSGPGC